MYILMKAFRKSMWCTLNQWKSPALFIPSCSPEDEKFVLGLRKNLMITRVHGKKKGGTYIYGDQTRW